jgi:hypothetical protein
MRQRQFLRRYDDFVRERNFPQMRRGRTRNALGKVPLRLDQDADHSVYQFELLRSRSIQKSLDPLSKVSFVFFSVQGQKDSRRQAESFGHSHNGVKAWNLFSSFDVSPKICGYVTALRSFLQTQSGALPESSNAFSELGAVLHKW